MARPVESDRPSRLERTTADATLRGKYASAARAILSAAGTNGVEQIEHALIGAGVRTTLNHDLPVERQAHPVKFIAARFEARDSKLYLVCDLQVDVPIAKSLDFVETLNQFTKAKAHAT